MQARSSSDIDTSPFLQDLVPDFTQFYKQYKSIQPYLQADKVPEDGSELRSKLPR